MSRIDRYTHEEDGMVYACPHCDKANLRKRKLDNQPRGNNVQIDPGFEFACYSCKTGVDEPVERESKSFNQPEGYADHESVRSAKSGLAQKLEQMSPDEIGI